MDFKYQLIPIILCHILVVVLICMTYKQVFVSANKIQNDRFPQNTSLKFVFITFGLMCLYTIFAYAEADTYYYMFVYKENMVSSEAYHVEPIHHWIMRNLSFDYFSWRFVTWGCSVLLVMKSIKRLHIDRKTSIFFIALFYLIEMARSREVLGISIFFYALSLFFCPGRKKLYSYVMSLVLIVCSFFFHRVMFAAIALALFMPFKFKKWQLWIVLMAFPFLINIVSNVVGYLQNNDLDLKDDSMGIASYAQIYANQDSVSSNINGMIGNLIQFGPILLLLFSATKKIVFEKIKVPPYINAFFMYWFFSTYIAFLFNFQKSSSFLFTRFWAFGFFPMIVVISFLCFKKGLNAIEKWAVSIGVLWSQYYFVYRYYLIYKGL